MWLSQLNHIITKCSVITAVSEQKLLFASHCVPVKETQEKGKGKERRDAEKEAKRAAKKEEVREAEKE